MEVSNLDSKAAQKFSFESEYPVLIINDIQNKGVAEAVGLKAGDLILTVGETAVHNMDEFSTEMEKISSGQTVEFTIMRIGMGRFGQVQRRYVVNLKAQGK